MATDYHGYPVPLGTAAPFVHLDLKALADAVDKDIPVVVNDYTALTQLAGITNLKALVKSLNYKMFIHNGTTWQVAGGVFGHAGKTNGFQAITAADSSFVITTAQILKGGMQFDSAFGGRLVVPVAGTYRVNAQYYYSGSSNITCFGNVYKNGAGTLMPARHMGWKAGDGSDHCASAVGFVQLAAGDKIGIGGNSSANAWGSDGFNGCYIEVELVGD